MSCPINKERLDELKLFIDICNKNPDILHTPQLSFFREYIESLGGKISPCTKMPADKEQEQPKATPAATPEEPEVKVESDPESDLELDTEGCVEPDTVDDKQKMGDSSKEVGEEDSDKADEKRRLAMGEFSEGNFEKSIELYTEAIELNPTSALLFAKRGQAYLKLTKPNACIKDCTKALELNPDSAAAYKFRGRAYRLLGEWEKAAKDLRQACNIDFDEQADEWLREVTPNAKKIELHRLKQERKKLEKEEREKRERIKKAREAHAKASSEGQTSGDSGFGSGPAPTPGMSEFYKLMQDPEIMAAFQDPELATAFQDISTNPANFAKYQSNPKIMALLKKLYGKFSTGEGGFPPGAAGGASGFPGGFSGGFPGAGGFGGGAGAGAGAGFPGFPGSFPNFGGAPPTNKPPEDDNLD